MSFVKVCIVCILILSATSAFGQTDRGAITGAVSDRTGAVIPGVSVVATNTQTNARYETVTTETGNYTLSQMPAGAYQVVVELPGFRRYVRQGVTVLVAQTLRIDVELEVGASTDEITVTADASLLRTETSELSHNVSTSQMNELPLLGIGSGAAGSSGIRNPLAVTQLVPGAYWLPNSTLRVNNLGSPLVRIDGQESNARIAAQAQTQPSVDALQEVAVQTSNYAAEFGQAGGAIFNYTLRSGANDWHGSGFEIFSHTKLNAGRPFTSTGGANRRDGIRANNFGFSVGGPIIRDKTFFFGNFERFVETRKIDTQQHTLPTAAYRNGDFSAVLTGQRLTGTDPLGRAIMEGAIYDPATTRIVNGQVVRDPFLDNQIPRDRMDPVALKIQGLLPMPTTNGLVNNFRPTFPADRTTYIPSVKIDHNLSNRTKISASYQRTDTFSFVSTQFSQADGIPGPATEARTTDIVAHVGRLNFEHSLSPTTLFHFGAGFLHNNLLSATAIDDFDQVKELGLRGATVQGKFPTLLGLSAARGGAKNLGVSGNQDRTIELKPTANTNLTLVRNNHTYKFGGEMVLEGMVGKAKTRTNARYSFSAAQTALPYLETTSVGGRTIGFPYASFLLGLVDNGDVSPPINQRLGKSIWGFYAQDSWKVSRTLTIDYGLRWDYFTYLKEHHGRAPQLSPTTPNPAAGGILGASIFEGSGPGRCNCDFAKVYPWAFGPRLGVAWQARPGWVVRTGIGVSYSGTDDTRTIDFGNQNPFAAPAFGDAAMRLQDGIPSNIMAAAVWPKYNPGTFPIGGNPIGGGAPASFDPNAGRPGRVFQWNIGIQRELGRNLVVEATYVGNRAAWLPADGMRTASLNALSPERLAAFGLNLNNAADRALLRSRLNSPTAVQRGFSTPPYPGFPVTATVAQALRPFPQFETIDSRYSPLGNSWYDALQLKATKRLSHGLDVMSTFSWQKELVRDSDVNSVFDRSTNKTLSGQSRPLSLMVAANYHFPRLRTNAVVTAILSDWTYGAVLQYFSGQPLTVPGAQSQLNQLLFQGSGRANRVPGEPLFLKDLDCHCFDPNKEFVLNPAAWIDPPDGEFGHTSQRLDDFRAQRRPRESMSLARTFRLDRIREGISLNFRIELENVFNRASMPNPSTANARQTQTFDSNGNVVSGFGRIDTGASPGDSFQPRRGQIVARLRF